MNGLAKYADVLMTEGSIRRNTITENLRARKEGLESNLSDINAALTALEKNPELQALFDLVSRVH